MGGITLTAQAISNLLYFIFFVTNSTTYSASNNLKGSFQASPTLLTLNIPFLLLK